MQETKPTRKQRARKQPQPKPVEKAEHLQPSVEPEEVKELSVRDRRYLANNGNRYSKKPKAGTPTLGRATGYVTEVGLGTVQTTTAYDNSDLST